MIVCIECGREPPVPMTAPHVDWRTVLRVDHGWLEIRWGKAMRGMCCSYACLETFVRVICQTPRETA